jgi:hypothetical protein
LLALGFQDHRLLLALGLEDRGLAEALGLEDVGALLALGLHLPRHRIDQVARRLDVLDLDAVDLDAPGMGRLVDHAQHLGIDLVALGQRLVQVHRADHGADVGHHQVEDGDLQGGDLVRGLGRIQHLEEDHAVDLHHRVVLGDDVLAGTSSTCSIMLILAADGLNRMMMPANSRISARI